MKTEPDRSGSTLTAGSGLRLGVAGFRHADLFNPHRLRDLTEIFEREVERAEHERLWPSILGVSCDARGDEILRYPPQGSLVDRLARAQYTLR